MRTPVRVRRAAPGALPNAAQRRPGGRGTGMCRVIPPPPPILFPITPTSPHNIGLCCRLARYVPQRKESLGRCSSKLSAVWVCNDMGVADVGAQLCKWQGTASNEASEPVCHSLRRQSGGKKTTYCCSLTRRNISCARCSCAADRKLVSDITREKISSLPSMRAMNSSSRMRSK